MHTDRSLSEGQASSQGKMPTTIMACPLTWVEVVAPGPQSSSCLSRSPPSHPESPGHGALVVLHGHGGHLSSAERQKDRVILTIFSLPTSLHRFIFGRPVNLYTAGVGQGVPQHLWPL